MRIPLFIAVSSMAASVVAGMRANGCPHSGVSSCVVFCSVVG
jgi:hypothetical protein